MARTGTDAHDGIGDGTPWARIAAAGYYYAAASENVARGYADLPAVMEGWLDSPGHLRNVLGPYRDFGGAAAAGPDGTLAWCAVFGTPTGVRTGVVL